MKAQDYKVVAAITREPYRLFFPLGVLMGTIGVSHWLFYSLGILKTYSGFFHSSVQILVYMNCFIIGFLLTALPRFSAGPHGPAHATIGEVGYFLFVLTGIVIFLSLNLMVMAEVCYVLWLLGLVKFAVSRIRSRRPSASGGTPPQEMIWVPLGIVQGIIGTLVLVLAQLQVIPGRFLLVGKPMMEQGFLLSVVLGIGGFLIPRLLGTYPQAGPSAAVCDTGNKAKMPGPSMIPFHLYASGLLFASFWVEGLWNEQLGYALRALVIVAEFWAARVLLHWPRGKDLYIKLIWISVWMVALGFGLAAVFSDYRIAALHVAFIGGFSLMTFAIGTMVTMSHSGEGESLHERLWILWVVALGISLAVVKRAAVVWLPDAYFKLLGVSAAFWLAAAWTWLGFIFPRILKVPAEDEFGKLHEAAKQGALH